MVRTNDGKGQNKQNLRSEAEDLLDNASMGSDPRFPDLVFWEPAEIDGSPSDSDTSTASSFSYDKLLRELHIHQIELEMQNEDLRQKQTDLEVMRDQYRNLYEFAPVGYMTLSREGLILEMNLTGASLFGKERHQLLRRRFSSMVVYEERDHWYRHFLHVLRHEGNHSLEITLTREGKKTFHASLNCLKICGGASPVVRIGITDVSDRKKVTEELRIAAIAFESQEAIMVTDASGVILRVNQSFLNLSGYSMEEIVGKSFLLLQSGHHDPSFYRNQQEQIQSSRYWQGEMWNRRKNGKTYPEWVTISSVTDSNGSTTHYVYNFSDIQRNREAEAEIHRLAYYDALTQLPNRRLLLDRMELALTNSSRSGNYGAIFMLDLDKFKMLNDTQGHDAGDEVLVGMAQRLHNTLRESDTVSRIGSTISRMGGDEFVVVLEDLSPELVEAASRARQVAEKLQKVFSRPYSLSTGDLVCTSSIGITLFHKQDLSVNKLLKQADLALYEAKQNKGNTFHFFDPAMQAEIDRQKEQEVCLKQALARNQFQVYYQPLTDMDQTIIGVEALLRWKQPKTGMKSPRDFIHLTDKNGLMLPIGEWVLENACSQIKSWAEKSIRFPFQLSINISACQFNHPSFIQSLKKILVKTGIHPSFLMIEITENIALKNLEKTIAIIKDLKEIGFRVSLDSFGTGIASMNALRQLPVDQLKIDGSLIRNIMTNAFDQAMVSSLISIGKSLGVKVHAMGVETQEQFDFLKDHGCDSLQGYLISHPLQFKEFEQVMMLMISLQKEL